MKTYGVTLFFFLLKWLKGVIMIFIWKLKEFFDFDFPTLGWYLRIIFHYFNFFFTFREERRGKYAGIPVQ